MTPAAHPACRRAASITCLPPKTRERPCSRTRLRARAAALGRVGMPRRGERRRGGRGALRVLPPQRIERRPPARAAVWAWRADYAGMLVGGVGGLAGSSARARCASRCCWRLWEASPMWDRRQCGGDGLLARPTPSPRCATPPAATRRSCPPRARRRRGRREPLGRELALRAAPRRRCPRQEADFSSYEGAPSGCRYGAVCALPSLGVAVLL